MLASDGWKKKANNQGESLVNCLGLKADGGSVFLQIMRPGDQRKTADWIVSAHELLALNAAGGEVAGDGWDQCIIGIGMANTAANMLALSELTRRHPTWINIGCMAHSAWPGLASVGPGVRRTMVLPFPF